MKHLLLCLVILAGCLLGAGASGLGAISTEHGPRLITESTNLTVHPLRGDPVVDGNQLGEDILLIDEDDLTPWNGYERTWLPNLTGNGIILVRDSNTGIVLTTSPSPSRPAQTGEQPSEDPPEDQERAPGKGPVDPEDAPGSAPEDDEPQGHPEPSSEERASDAGEQVKEKRVPAWLPLAGALVLAAAPTVWRWIRGSTATPDPPSSDHPVDHQEETADHVAHQGHERRGHAGPRRYLPRKEPIERD